MGDQQFALILREIGAIRGQFKSGLAVVAERISSLEQKIDGVGATAGT